MIGRTLLICASILTALTAPSAAWGQPPEDAFKNHSKKDLYDAGQRYRSKWLDSIDDFDICQARLAGAKKKLGTRTSTAIRALVVPPIEKTGPVSGSSTELVVIIAIGGLALGAVLGGLLMKDSNPSVIVTK